MRRTESVISVKVVEIDWPLKDIQQPGQRRDEHSKYPHHSRFLHSVVPQQGFAPHSVNRLVHYCDTKSCQDEWTKLKSC